MTENIHGQVSLTKRDLEVIRAALEVAYSGEQETWGDMFTETEVAACDLRIGDGIKESETW